MSDHHHQLQQLLRREEDEDEDEDELELELHELGSVGRGIRKLRSGGASGTRSGSGSLGGGGSSGGSGAVY
ncbi:hypothetical protein CERZMDRAFT_91566 [Cercospora zeae-maydis SCOH1-5]|uniref:Uncharacterized protein n=1 Tax=Cercospora zeae-maydis SCOH1-5 TaxID=717836 RepID=A0A6A6F3R2_9PEZI|nr:hypothetical protein CERZMDRAFT_91566 [Cercospora zeae-maydis SCOH1-5]